MNIWQSGLEMIKIQVVRDYIANQEEHHKKHSFEEEYNKFIQRYGFEIIKH